MEPLGYSCEDRSPLAQRPSLHSDSSHFTSQMPLLMTHNKQELNVKGNPSPPVSSPSVRDLVKVVKSSILSFLLGQKN